MKFLKIGIALLSFGLILTRLEAAGYKICKPSEFSDDLPEIRLDKKYARQHKPSAHWSKDVKEIIPSDPISSLRYKLVIDLQGLSESYLDHVSAFLTALNQDSEINPKVPVLVIENGTSGQYKKISAAVKKYFETSPLQQVHYLYKGAQRPLRSLKEFSSESIGSRRSSETSTVSAASSADAAPHEYGYSFPIEMLEVQMRRLVTHDVTSPNSSSTLSTEEGSSEFSSSSTFSEISSEGEEETYSVDDPETMLQLAIIYGEKQEQEEILKGRWLALGGTTWPPLGVNRKEQIASLSSTDLENDVVVLAEDIRVLRVSGLFPGALEKITTLCHSHPALRALIIENSCCQPEEFKGFHVSNTPTEEDPDLLGEKGIQFVDVRTAFGNGGDISDIEAHYKRHGQGSSLDYFVGFPSFMTPPPAFTALSENEKKSYYLYEIFFYYLKYLNY